MVPPTRRTALRILGTAGIATLAGCPTRPLASDNQEQPPDSLGTTYTPPTDEWRYPRGGLQNRAHVESTVQGQPSIKWRVRKAVEAESRTGTHLAAATREMVVLATERAGGLELSAHDTADGATRWRLQLDGSESLYPWFGGLVDETLYLSDLETDVIAVDATAGKLRWRRNLYERVAEMVSDEYLLGASKEPEDFAPLPFATPDCVYVQSTYGIHGLDPENGQERWRLYLGDDVGDEDDNSLRRPSGLAITEDRVVATYSGFDHLVMGIRLHDGGAVVDQTTVPVRYPSQPLLTDDGTTVLDSGITWSTDAEMTLVAGAAETTVATWQFQGLASTGPGAFSSTAYDGSRVFICEGHEATEEVAVFALRAATGGLEWLSREPLSEAGITLSPNADFRMADPAVVGDTLLMGYGTSTQGGDATGTLVAFSTAEGRERWRVSLPVAPRDIAPTANGVYVGGQRTGMVGFTMSE